jgi:DNA-binding transcriptional LysR family regulator
MPDHRLHIFREVAELGSLTKASRRLHLSQPAITKHIKLLEEEFRLPLFVRSAVGVRLTEAGLILLKHVQQTEDLYEQVRQKMETRQEELSGRIRLGCSTTITQYFFPRTLLALKKKHPAVEVEVIEGNSDFVISAVLAQRIELGLIESPCRRRDLRVRSFYEDEIILVASPQDSRTHLKPADLQKEPLVFREVGSGTRLCVEGALNKLGLTLRKLNIVQELPSTEAIKRVVAGGLGLGFVSKLSVADEIQSGQLVQLKVRGLNIQRPFSAILPLGPDPVGLRQLVLAFLTENPKSDSD